MDHYFVILDASIPEAARVNGGFFDTLEEAVAFAFKYHLADRPGGYEIYKGEKVA